MSENKLNVLWICVDEFRPECMGAAGHELVQTPALDALAAEGVLFKNAFCQGSPCAPSRMSIHTGRYVCSTGVVDNLTPLRDAENNLAMHLRSQGVQPALIGYNDYARDPAILPEGHPHKTSLNFENVLPGYDVILKHEYDSPEWYAWLKSKGYPEELCNWESMYSTQVPEGDAGDHLPCVYPARYSVEHSEMAFVTEKSLEFIQETREEPWFLSVNYIKPHGPYICADPFHALVDPADVPAPLRREEESLNRHPYMSRCRADWAQTEFLKEQDWREIRACYYGMISELDFNLARLFTTLKETGQWENTAIIFSGDHGSYLGDHYLAGKPHYFDAAMRVPLIIRDPSAQADCSRGTQNEALVENVDLAPLICNFLNATPSPEFQGKDPRHLLLSPQGATHKDEIFYEFYYYNLLQDTKGVDPDACRLWVLRDHNWKYVHFGEESLAPQLFDLQNDPGEFTNLAQSPAHSAVLTDCCQRMLRWRMRNEEYTLERWARTYR
ncbi:MAG: sulfatase-like hydrolase/transferase [Candidatus Hydrogenedens sp.]|jgi:arylsulfatase A-like enzyme|nr:sulfatase-like hydrolase/transferase [Candidatus Hydrogenedens sp.]